MKTVCSFLIVSIGSLLLCKNVYPFIVDGRVGRQCTGVKHRAFTETAENVDHLEKTEGERSREEARALEWERRQKKNKICQSMPRSQKWFKAMQQHVSPNQKRMYNDYWPVHGVDLKYGLKLIPHELFTSNTVTAATAVVLDIGFGMGDSIVGMAQQNTDKIYLGCEIHRAGISTALGNISSLGIVNVKIVRADVKMLLDTSLSEKCLDEVCIFFPDPWPNTERDGERRVVRKDIVKLLSGLMKQGGVLRIATDVPDYAMHVRHVMDSSPEWRLKNLVEHLPCVGGPSYRPVTRYEKKAVELSNWIWDYEYVYTG